MNISLIGYGKMGRMIEEILLSRGHRIACIIDESNQEDFNSSEFLSSDVAIEFSRPDAAPGNIMRCFGAGIPVVCGTTGWSASMPSFREICSRGEATLLWSSNFSIGMNIFMALNRYLTGLMKNFPEYSPLMEETHHIHKLDHPSGTAITLAEDIIAGNPRINGWTEIDETLSKKEMPGSVLPVRAHREGEVAGIHTIIWDSPSDSISITHSAKSRRGFALGAVLAAEWLVNENIKGGFYSMKDVLHF